MYTNGFVRFVMLHHCGKRAHGSSCSITVGNGHTVRSANPWEGLAHVVKIPMYRFFAGEDHVKKPNIREIIPSHAANSKQDRELRAFAT
jgi:hypothetical protein